MTRNRFITLILLAIFWRPIQLHALATNFYITYGDYTYAGALQQANLFIYDKPIR